MSDSGGIQEEAVTLGKPVLLLREETERPEGVNLGGVIKVGHDFNTIVKHAQQFLHDEKKCKLAVAGISPYGDGFAADKIVGVLAQHFGDGLLNRMQHSGHRDDTDLLLSKDT